VGYIAIENGIIECFAGKVSPFLFFFARLGEILPNCLTGRGVRGAKVVTLLSISDIAGSRMLPVVSLAPILLRTDLPPVPSAGGLPSPCFPVSGEVAGLPGVGNAVSQSVSVVE